MKSSTTDGGSGASSVVQKSEAISREEWLKALDDAGIDNRTDDQSALTAAELGAMLGIDRQAVERRMEKLIAHGKATKTQKRAKTVNGRSSFLVAYRLA